MGNCIDIVCFIANPYKIEYYINCISKWLLGPYDTNRGLYYEFR